MPSSGQSWAPGLRPGSLSSQSPPPKKREYPSWSKSKVRWPRATRAPVNPACAEPALRAGSDSPTTKTVTAASSGKPASRASCRHLLPAAGRRENNNPRSSVASVSSTTTRTSFHCTNWKSCAQRARMSSPAGTPKSSSAAPAALGQDRRGQARLARPMIQGRRAVRAPPRIERATLTSRGRGARVRHTTKNSATSTSRAASGASSRSPAAVTDLPTGAGPACPDGDEENGSTRARAGPSIAATAAASDDTRATMPAAKKRLLRFAVSTSAATGAMAARPPTASQPIPEAHRRLARCRPQTPRPSNTASATPPVAPISRSNPATSATHASSGTPPRWPSHAARTPSTIPTTAPLTRAAR